MSDICKLQQLVNIYKVALNDGIDTDQWLNSLREKVNAYGRDFIVRENELIGNQLFLEWVASKRTGKVKLGDFHEEEGRILLALHRSKVPINGESETILEATAYEYAVNKASGEGAFKLEDAYNKLLDTTKHGDAENRHDQFNKLQNLVFVITEWLDGCKIIDIDFSSNRAAELSQITSGEVTAISTVSKDEVKNTFSEDTNGLPVKYESNWNGGKLSINKESIKYLGFKIGDKFKFRVVKKDTEAIMEGVLVEITGTDYDHGHEYTWTGLDFRLTKYISGDMNLAMEAANRELCSIIESKIKVFKLRG